MTDEFKVYEPRRITRATKAADAAERYRRQYDYGAKMSGAPSPGPAFPGLLALGPTPDPDDVDRIVGNRTWTWSTCDACRRTVDAVTQVGEPEGYESSTADLCDDCLRAACRVAGIALAGEGV